MSDIFSDDDELFQDDPTQFRLKHAKFHPKSPSVSSKKSVRSRRSSASKSEKDETFTKTKSLKKIKVSEKINEDKTATTKKYSFVEQEHRLHLMKLMQDLDQKETKVIPETEVNNTEEEFNSEEEPEDRRTQREQMVEDANIQVRAQIEGIKNEYFYRFRKSTNKKKQNNNLTGLTLNEIAEQFVSESNENNPKELLREFIAFLFHERVNFRICSFVVLKGNFPSRYRFRYSRKSDEPVFKVNKSLNIAKYLNQKLLLIERISSGQVEKINGNSVPAISKFLSGKNVIMLLAFTLGPGFKVKVGDATVLHLHERTWSQMRINQLNCKVMPDLEEEFSPDDVFLPQEIESIEEQLKARIPVSNYEFRLHPYYIIKTALTRSEIIRPGADPTGLLYRNIEPIYNKSDILFVQGKTKWRMQGRNVKEGEQPLKILERFIGQKALELYSEAQTEPYILKAVDGKLPVNEYGNVELFTGVPEGCAHINEQGAWRACKALGVEYKHAVTGFELKKGRNIAKKEGIIVLEEHKKDVLKQWKIMKKEIEEKEKKKKEDMILGEWKKLFKSLLIRRYIANKYDK